MFCAIHCLLLGTLGNIAVLACPAAILMPLLGQMLPQSGTLALLLRLRPGH